eukprot:CAMPEP_0113664168 /NCGR_PEP_ID=MMETSP0038_2-20120614/1575_1 /TAXON_ID=2898 /ORGANISM="Cryptomonas paramecium" /LENGTH=150 /DNA_ID=CAMNT_0000579331 /DNA_START=549 /DNA_END=998 /DNA_ORIENTATION=+ /assembly_acc=CAM_ASM_000170
MNCLLLSFIFTLVVQTFLLIALEVLCFFSSPVLTRGLGPCLTIPDVPDGLGVDAVAQREAAARGGGGLARGPRPVDLPRVVAREDNLPRLLTALLPRDGARAARVAVAVAALAGRRCLGSVPSLLARLPVLGPSGTAPGALALAVRVRDW